MATVYVNNVLIAFYMLRRRKQRQKNKKRRFWVRPFHVANVCHSATVVAAEMNSDSEKFKSFYRMNQENFLILVDLVSPLIQKKDTNYRLAVSPEERLLITLR